MQINPYLTFNGNCAEAFRFYEKVLGGKIAAIMTFADTPMADQMPPEGRGKIAHARLAVGDSVLMGSDCMPGSYEPMKGVSVTLNIADPAEAERVFAGLSEKGTVTMPIAETFWAQRFGMLTDKFGTPWMVGGGMLA